MTYPTLSCIPSKHFVLAALLAVHTGSGYLDIGLSLGIPRGEALVRIGVYCLESVLPALSFPRTEAEWLHQASAARFRTGAINFAGALDVRVQYLMEAKNPHMYVLAVIDGIGRYTYAHIECPDADDVDKTDLHLLMRSSLGRELAAVEEAPAMV